MISDKENIAVIGAGYWGTIIVNTLLQIKCKKIFIYDNNFNNIQLLNRRYPKLIACKTYLEILKNDSIKSILIATPPSVNFEICKKAIEYNKNIYIEKPVVKNLNQMLKLKKMLLKKKKVFMSGYVYCYNDYINYIKKIIKKKSLGNIKYINLIRKNFGPVRSDVSCNLDLSSHDISILLHLFNHKIKKINCLNHSILKKNIFDINTTSYKIGKIKIDTNSSWLYPEKLRKIVIVGEKKMLLYDEINLNEPIKIFDKYAKYPKIKFFENKFFDKKVKLYIGDSKVIKLKDTLPLVNELKHFFNCIKYKRKPLTSIDFAYEVLKILN